MSMDYSVFVPNGDSRHETAVLLVGTADEHSIDQRSIKATSAGFFITEELAIVVYDDPAEDSDPEPEEPTETPDEAPAKPGRTTSTSGNRAAKKSNVTDKE